MNALGLVLGLFRFGRAKNNSANPVANRLSATDPNVGWDALVRKKLGEIEQKAGTLLTHISLMIAITALISTQIEGNDVFEFLILAELIAYLVLALLCVRCLLHLDQGTYRRWFETKPDKNGQKPSNYMNEERGSINHCLAEELLLREAYFAFSIRALYVLTFVLAGTLILKQTGGLENEVFQEVDPTAVVESSPEPIEGKDKK